jgi:hypothetical protein
VKIIQVTESIVYCTAGTKDKYVKCLEEKRALQI